MDALEATIPDVTEFEPLTPAQLGASTFTCGDVTFVCLAPFVLLFYASCALTICVYDACLIFAFLRGWPRPPSPSLSEFTSFTSLRDMCQHFSPHETFAWLIFVYLCVLTHACMFVCMQAVTCTFVRSYPLLMCVRAHYIAIQPKTHMFHLTFRLCLHAGP